MKNSLDTSHFKTRSVGENNPHFLLLSGSNSEQTPNINNHKSHEKQILMNPTEKHPKYPQENRLSCPRVVSVFNAKLLHEHCFAILTNYS